MDTIVCFGDSNTYGFNPENGGRYNETIRWSGILKNHLKYRYEVIEAGQNNRTCFSINPEKEELTGYKSLPQFINQDTKVLILQIGINDLQKFYNPTDVEIKNGLKNLIKIAKNINPNIKILILAPSKINDCIKNSYFNFLFNKTSIEKSKIIKEIYKEVANNENCNILILDDFVETSDIDGIHYEKDAHKKIADTIINNYFKFFI